MHFTVEEENLICMYHNADRRRTIGKITAALPEMDGDMRALAQQTPCLILDEPTNHLDITHQLQLMHMVKNLNVTVISAIHDLNIAAMFCDRIYVLKNGEIAAHGKTEEVLTRELISDIYKVEVEIVKDHKGQMHILFL